MLHTIYSNYFEVLQACLIENLKADAAAGADVFEPQSVIIPSLAVADRLRQEIARRTGVCCGFDFKFIGSWFEEATSVESANEHTSQSLVWPIWRILRERDFTDRFPPLAQYVAGKSDEQLYDFALRIASIFRRYIAYRLDRVLEWIGVQSAGRESAQRQRERLALERHPDYAWQKALWEKLADESVWPDCGNLTRLPEFFSAPASGSARPVHIFMPTVVPPIILPFLSAMTAGDAGQEVWLYIQNPSSGFWFEGIDLADRTPQGELQTYMARNAKSTRATIDRLWLFSQEDGQHSSLAERLFEELPEERPDKIHPAQAHGRQDAPARLSFDFVAQRIQDFRSGEHVQAERIYIDPAPECDGNMLQRLQSAIVNLDSHLLPVEADQSIRIVKAPNALREVQAVCDYLQTRFSKAGLKASDVLVATPDLEQYIPLIHSVFGSLPKERSIPYRIVGSGLTQENLAAQAVINLGDMIQAQMSADQFFSWLELPIVTRHWNLDFDDLEILRGWLRAAGFRYGISRAHMRSMKREADAEGCLESALERLALGFTQSPDRVRLFADTLPVASASLNDYNTVVSRADLLEKLMLIAERLEQARAHLQDEGEIHVLAWADTWNTEIEGLLGSETQSPELVSVRRTIGSICKQMRRGLPDDSTKLPFSLVWHAFKSQLSEQKAPVRNADAVTFADISHSRGLPFKVIAVLGLGQESRFPGVQRTESFDLMELADDKGQPIRRIADRDSRSDNRNVFLDLVLCARESLYLSYCAGEGKSAGKPMSPVLEDFARLLEIGQRLETGDPELRLPGKFSATLTAEVPLTEESLKNFLTEGARFWRSHSEQLLASLQAASSGSCEDDPFADTPSLLAQGKCSETVDYSDVEQFWSDEDKWMLSHHGLKKDGDSGGKADLPINPDGGGGLAAWAWKEKLLELKQSGIGGDELREIAARDPINGAEGVRRVAAGAFISWLEESAEGAEGLDAQKDEQASPITYPLQGAKDLIAGAGLDAAPFAALDSVVFRPEKLLENPVDGSLHMAVQVFSDSLRARVDFKRAFLCAAGLSVTVHLSDYKNGESGVVPPLDQKAAVETVDALLALYLVSLAAPAPGIVSSEYPSKVLWRGREKEQRKVTVTPIGKALKDALAMSVAEQKKESKKRKAPDWCELLKEVSHA